MNKQKLIRFIDKYHLSGLAESVILDSNLDNKTLTTVEEFLNKPSEWSKNNGGI